MAVKIALAVGLFIVICGSPGLKSSQVIPDGLIYTEVKKTLVRGAQGVLTCRFEGVPLAVYWRKGLDLDDLRPIIVWHDGKVSGPRFNDGSCDVDENYSLIINNVSTADVGRMYCTVSNNKGPLMNNYTDILVVDTAITTNSQATLQLRQTTHIILECTIHIKARKVSWKKGTTSSANENLVVIENNKNAVERSGAGYDDGTYNITQDYSLVIKELQVHHEGLYVCEVTDDTGISFRNHTFVNVVAQPLEPFPTIQECLNTEQHDPNYCILVAKSGMTLTCQAVMYYPSIKLVLLYGSTVLEPTDTRVWNNTDGTKNKIITIATRGDKELYRCVASSIPGTNANKSTSVLLQGDEAVESTLVKILVLFAALTLISSVAYFIWRKKQLDYSAVQRSAPHEELKEVKDLSQKDFQALEQHVNDVLIKHYRRCHDLLETGSAVQTDKIISENRTALFNTHQMLTDWRASQTSRRVKQNKEIAHAWPSNKELKSISRHLTQESMKEICKKLKIDCRNDDAHDEEKRLEALRKWRTKAVHKSLEEKYRQLAPVLRSNNLGGLLPTLRGPYIYKAELVDLAFHLLIHDLCPVAKELGINVTKLVSYRPAFHLSHLEKGTIKLLIELCASIKGSPQPLHKRFVFCNTIANLNYRNVAITGIFEYDMSYGELCAISEATDQSTERGANQELGNLQDVRQLTDQDIADHPDTSHALTAYALYKTWNEKPRQSVLIYRAASAHKLRRNGMPGLADEIIAGKYITEQTSLPFVEDMVQGLKPDQIRCLGELLQLIGGNEQWHTTTPFNEISKQIYHWVADWTTGIKGSWFSDTFAKQRTEKHRDLNDQLVEHGFLDLAREIMIIEQQQLDY